MTYQFTSIPHSASRYILLIRSINQPFCHFLSFRFLPLLNMLIQVRNFFRSRESTPKRDTDMVAPTTTIGIPPRYSLLSNEAQTRMLADLSLLFQDYETAASSYRLCLSDYKNDKETVFAASASEFLGVSSALSDKDPLLSYKWTESSTSLKSAYQTYLSVNDLRRAIRCLMWQYDLLRHRGSGTKLGGGPSSILGGLTSPLNGSQLSNNTSTSIAASAAGYPYISVSAHALQSPPLILGPRAKEAASVLEHLSNRLSDDPGVKGAGALLLEQTAYALLMTAPPQCRKYAFHLVLAAHLYTKGGHRAHAIRCYASALARYSRRGWLQMEDFLHMNIGKDCYYAQEYALAVKHYSLLIGRGDHQADRIALTPHTESDDGTILATPNDIPSNSWHLPSTAVNKTSMTSERQNILLRELVSITKKWLGTLPNTAFKPTLTAQPSTTLSSSSSPSVSTPSLELSGLHTQPSGLWLGELNDLALPSIYPETLRVYTQDPLHVPPELVYV